MKLRTTSFDVTEEIDAAIERERLRLSRTMPGTRVTMSMALKSLILRAAEKVELENAH